MMSKHESHQGMFQDLNDGTRTARPMTDAMNKQMENADVEPMANEFELDELQSLDGNLQPKEAFTVQESVVLEQRRDENRTSYQNDAEMVNESTKTGVP